MTRAAVVFADGCEEIEGLSQVDVFRRLGVECDMVGLNKLEVNGDHNIKIICDKLVDESLLDYDMVSFPGGKPGAIHLRDSVKLNKLMNQRHAAGKWCAAMCAAPIALGKYGLLNQAEFTCYPGFEKEILAEAPEAKFSEAITVTDKKQKIVTSRGPATALAFSYALAEALGIDTDQLQEGMLYKQFKPQNS
ncbi:DJ-1 family glyoxalase III [Lactobacillus corticis]|uniref:4-methyl-5(B-hydroxyethyl)-thiazole monophosphate biosynthesis protein n=1 Tax=Lactobacillus corticis TaxID=2201249 RepID=A0A916VJB2_9LACO|nr:DJ-1 family glyoxalase III [Lactobacillus corticis]GFZ27584.1 4-methyl-5(B-hydroxyethyl)-thiazole monophosphate biosynthesis protein [Lactobacillus corticis]